MKLSAPIHQFFDHYLPHIKGVSPYTIKAYRDAFKFFLPFAAKHYGIKIKSLRVEHLSSQLILSFLDDLQKLDFLRLSGERNSSVDSTSGAKDSCPNQKAS